MMPRLLLAMALTSVLADRPEVTLLDGTPVVVRLLRMIASDISAPGDPVQLAVNSDVTIDSVVVIEKGAPVAGAIVEAGPSQLWSRPARLSFVIQHTSSISGQTIRLRTSRDTLGEQRIEIHNHRSALLLWAAPGKTFRAFVDGDYALPAPSQATPPAQRDDVLTNEHVVRLVSAGISEDLVIAKIHAGRTAFRIGTDDLIELKQAGVSDRVMLAMIDATQEVIRLPTPAIK